MNYILVSNIKDKDETDESKDDEDHVLSTIIAIVIPLGIFLSILIAGLISCFRDKCKKNAEKKINEETNNCDVDETNSQKISSMEVSECINDPFNNNDLQINNDAEYNNNLSTPENYETNSQDEKPYYSQKNQGQDYLPLPTNYYPPSDNTPNNQYPPSNQTHYIILLLIIMSMNNLRIQMKDLILLIDLRK